jgi:hypothetical protein
MSLLPPGTATTKLQVVRTPADPHWVATATVRSFLTAILTAAVVTLTAEAATMKAPTTEPRAGGGGNRGGRDHKNSHASGASQGAYDAR